VSVVTGGNGHPVADHPGTARRRVAVVGAGVAGLTTAWLLAPNHAVTLFDREARAGGHTNTVTIPDGPDAGTPVDTGFIVMNHRNYPRFSRLLERLGVELQDSDMSFSFHCERTRFHYAGNGFDGLFAQRRHLASPSFWTMLAGMARFNAVARRDLAAGSLASVTLAEYARERRVSDAVSSRYLLPMGSAIWSAPMDEIGRFPAEAFLRFFENHGLLGFRGQPQWRTVKGGSHTYVRAMLASLTGTLRLSDEVRGVRRPGRGVEVVLQDRTERFDDVVIATHADEALRLLVDPSPEERRLLGAWRYSENRTVLHTDISVLPPRRRAWSAWNFAREAGANGASPVSVTYHMNRLQRLRVERDYCVTLNRRGPIAPGSVLREMTYTHPLYTFDSLATQPGLRRLNGTNGTWYCGSYFGWGFHEDAVRSGAEVALAFGAEL
jgi:predicted NAD/FAD-binding protein